MGVWLGLPATPIRAADSLSLAGKWQFALDRGDVGQKEQWYNQNLRDYIQLPGILQAQGYGDEIGVQTPWVLTLYDHFWYERSEYAADTNTGHVKVPFLCQPPRHYLGAAWYQRDIDIPADWNEKRVGLFLERPHWKTTIWLDGREIGSDLSLCTPHQYMLGCIPPGRHRLTIWVDNRLILPYRPDAHSVSDSLGAAWNGIVGRIELQASDQVCLEEMRLDPDLERKGVKVTLFTHNDTAQPVNCPRLDLEVSPGNFDGPVHKPVIQSAVIEPGDTNLVFFYPMGNDFEEWSEFNPKCYTLTATLGGTEFHSEITGTFGMREFKAIGNQFILNGRPIYFRGTHNGGDFPLTGYPPTDVASWKKIFQTCQEYGLNHMRFHSWCPPEAAFEAADDLGIYVQVEPGMWNSFAPGGEMVKTLYAETRRILRTYGNHPSLMLVSASNEAHGNWKQCLAQWAEDFHAEDPRHLYTPDTGWALTDSPGSVTGADYLDVARIGRGPVRGVSGWFGSDFRNSIAGINVPVVAHEVGQWCAYPDYDIIKKFNGFLQPGNYEIFRDSLAAQRMLDRDKDFVQASGRFQLECYKEEIEANLRTPGLDGFQLLDLHDYVGQGTALVGVLDTFWDSKGYAPPVEFREFCNRVVPLARLTNSIFTTSNPLDVPVEAANFSGGPLADVKPIWKVTDLAGNIYAHGEWPARTIPLGKNIDLGAISCDLSTLPAPRQYRLCVQLVATGTDTTFQNHWNFWLYPAHLSDSIPTNVLVTSSWDAAAAKLSAGGNVLFLPEAANLDWMSPPLATVPIFWDRQMNPEWSRMLGLWCDTNHPALAEFPTDSYCDRQWMQILRGVRAVNLDRLPRHLQPIVQAIDDWNRNWKLGVLFDCRVGRGKLMFCTIDLNHDLDQRPVAKQLRRSLLDYMASETFKPRTAISLKTFRSLYFDSRIMRELGASAEADGANADAVIDGNPNTFWSTAQRDGQPSTPYPHVLTITFPAPVSMRGIVVMSQQNDRDRRGDAKEYKIETINGNGPWREISHGVLASTWDPQTIHFAQTVTATRLRFISLSGFGTHPSTALAELAVLYVGSGR